MSFTIRNNGTETLTALKLTRSGKHRKDFIVSTLPKTQLTPGESIRFRVEFRPRAAGTRTSRIHIQSNDSDENPFDIMLGGAGVSK